MKRPFAPRRAGVRGTSRSGPVADRSLTGSESPIAAIFSNDISASESMFCALIAFGHFHRSACVPVDHAERAAKGLGVAYYRRLFAVFRLRCDGNRLSSRQHLIKFAKPNYSSCSALADWSETPFGCLTHASSTKANAVTIPIRSQASLIACANAAFSTSGRTISSVN
jgi:hypothetical protein